jgi:phospholipid/cholesterol/gamma-HCH transport system ATP-binding protein
MAGLSKDDAAVVVAQNVSRRFGGVTAVADVSMQVRKGELLGIMGPNGAGKSTLLSLLSGARRPSSGSLEVCGRDFSRIRHSEAAHAGVGLAHQIPKPFRKLTVRENVGYKLIEELHWPREKADERITEVLGFVGLTEFIDRMPSDLSGGQRRRVAIARAMAAKPRILLYDEPTTGLDPITSLTVDEEIIKLRDLEGVSSVLVTHQLRDAFFVAEHAATRSGTGIEFERAAEGKAEQAEFIMLKDGQILFEGNANELRVAAKTDEYIQSFLS